MDEYSVYQAMVQRSFVRLYPNRKILSGFALTMM
jgi:hypothetical protein